MNDNEIKEINNSIEEILQRIEYSEVHLLDLIISYYKGILSKGYENIKTTMVIKDLEEIKMQFERSK